LFQADKPYLLHYFLLINRKYLTKQSSKGVEKNIYCFSKAFVLASTQIFVFSEFFFIQRGNVLTERNQSIFEYYSYQQKLLLQNNLY